MAELTLTELPDDEVFAAKNYKPRVMMIQGKIRQVGYVMGLEYFMKGSAWRHKMNSLIHYNSYSRPRWNASLKV